MPSIPEYNTGIVRRRAVANTVNFQAIDDAGATMRGISKAADFGAEMAQKYKDADDLTALNEALIAKQKSDMEWIDAQRKARESNPNKFAKDLEPEIKKRDDEFMKGLSGAAKRQFKPTADRINLQTYESNLNWENTRKTQIFANRIQNSKDNLSIIAYRAGQEGKPPDDILKNAEATTVAGSAVFAPEQLANLREDVRKAVIISNLQGMMEDNPQKAKEIIDSKKYDADLGAESLMRLTGMAEAEIERKATKIAAANMQFANFSDMQAMAGDNETLQNQAAKYRKAALEDPAGYVSQHPEIQHMDAVISELPPEGQAIAMGERNTRVIELQKQMGIPSYRQSLVPLGVAKEVAYQITDPQTSPDEALQAYDQYMSTFSSNQEDAAGMLKEAGLDGSGLSPLVSMGSNSDRIGLVTAIKKKVELDKIIPKEDSDYIKGKVLTGIEGFSKSIAHLPNSTEQIMAYQSGAEELAKLYVSQGMARDVASKKALEETIKKNFHVIDEQVLIPAANNPSNIRRFLNKQTKLLSGTKILTPPSVPEGVKNDYRNRVAITAQPRTVGNWIMFYDQTGNPVLDEEKVQYDEYGNITNIKDSAVRFSIDAADAIGGMPSQKLHDDGQAGRELWQKKKLEREK